MVAALDSVVVHVRGRRERRGGGVGGGRRGGRRGRGVPGTGRVALGGGVVLGVRVVDEGDVGLGILYPELRVSHEVVDGRPGLGLLQALIEGDGAAECFHHPDLEGREGTGRGGGHF